MRIESLVQFTLSTNELSSLYEVCGAALEHNLLDVDAFQFAMQIIDTFSAMEEDTEDEEPQVVTH